MTTCAGAMLIWTVCVTSVLGHGVAHADPVLAGAHAPPPVARAHEDLLLTVQVASTCTGSCGWFRAVAYYTTFVGDGSVEDFTQPSSAGSFGLQIPGEDMVACCYGAGTITYFIEITQRQCSEECKENVVRLPRHGSYEVFVIG